MLFDRYAGKMKYVCLRYLRNDADAEDALQDGFIKLFSSIDQYTGKGSFEGWMRRIFVNYALMHIRKRKAAKEDLHDGTLDENLFFVEPGEVEEGVEASEIDHENVDYSLIEKADFSKEELMSCISALKEDYKIVFNLYFIDNFKHAEIASMLGIDEKNSRTRLVRARKKIQEELYKRSIKKVAV